MALCHRLAITPGTPAGIGPDIVLAASRLEWANQLIAVCDPDLLIERAQQLKLPVSIETIDLDTPATPHQPDRLWVHPVSCPNKALPGELNPANGEYVLQTLQVATQLCASQHAQALVTGPVHKAAINEAGIAFSGHTEYLAELTNTDRVVMMLVSDDVRVGLVTTHLPLKDVSDNITQPDLTRVIEIIHEACQTHFGIKQPRIIVCGLNPHAGEQGHLGMEEVETITPACERLRERGWSVEGPISADTAFLPSHLSNSDVVLSMFHDQGLPVIKHLGFGNAVNITLGLPIIRTSVDHGTALHLAGTGNANVGSILAAIEVASDMAALRFASEG